MSDANDDKSPLPFWVTKDLGAMSRREWESLCDGCGRCCVHRFEDEETGAIFETRVACRLLDLHSCRCRHYPTRHRYVPECVVMTPETIETFHWLPETCAYRRLSRGQELPEWHPLLTGDPESVHRAGVSVRGTVVSEEEVDLGAIEAEL